MGQVEHGMQELESNGLGKSGSSKNLAQNSKGQPQMPSYYKLDSESLVNQPVEQNETRGAQNVESKLVSVQESSSGIREIIPSYGDISQDIGAGRTEMLLENAKALPVLGNLAVPGGPVCIEYGPISLEDLDLPPGFDFPNPNGNLEPTEKDVTNGPGNLEHENKGSIAKMRNREAKVKSPVTSSWSLRQKSQEKPEAQLNETAKQSGADGEKRKRGRKKKSQGNTADEFSRARTHLRYLLHRIKYEQSLIDAYSAEGWKGQSLEKLKPEKELQRAKSHILRYKLKIRDLFQNLDSSLAVGKLPASLFDSKGEIDSEDIFCAKCGSKDLSLENDIILCDGACERGFHQFCLEPPLLKQDIPPGDESWLCRGCDCKADCIDMLKDLQGTNITIIDRWEKIFPEAAAATESKMDGDSVSSSDDSEDEDYDPDKPDMLQEKKEEESCSNRSNYISASDGIAASPSNDKPMGLPLDDSEEEDDDFDPTAADSDDQVKQPSSSSDFSSDSEDLGALLDEATAPGKDPENVSTSSHPKQPSTVFKEESYVGPGMQRHSLKSELSYLVETLEKPVSGKRHVERLDYKKLHDETYGDSSSDSSDEDYEDDTVPKRRKIGYAKSGEMSSSKTPSTDVKMDTTDGNNKGSSRLTKRSRKNTAAGDSKDSSSIADGSPSTNTKRTKPKRLGKAVTQRLHEYFNENHYPERAVKEKMSNELGITIEEINRWFGHARWEYNHRPKKGSIMSEKPPEPQPTNPPDQVAEGQEYSPVPVQNQVTEGRVENSAINTSGENSGTRRSRKRKGKAD